MLFYKYLYAIYTLYFISNFYYIDGYSAGYSSKCSNFYRIRWSADQAEKSPDEKICTWEKNTCDTIRDTKNRYFPEKSTKTIGSCRKIMKEYCDYREKNRYFCTEKMNPTKITWQSDHWTCTTLIFPDSSL